MNWLKRILKIFEKKDTEPTTKDYFFIYGSLRKGEYNHYIMEKCSELMGLTKIKGFKLISLGSYPAIIPTGDKKDLVVGEVFKINDFNIINRVDGMELGAGYKRTMQKVRLDGDKKIKVIFYEYKKSISEYDLINSVVKSGDWVKFRKEKNNKRGR